MGFCRNLSRKIAAAFAGTLLLCGGVSAEAQTITNIAEASWQANGTRQRMTSNPVTIAVSRTATLIETFRPLAGATTSAPVNGTRCGGEALTLVGSDLGSGAVASVDRTTTFRIGDALVFRVTAPQANTNPATLDTITTILTTTSGDREVVEVMETAADSGVFVGGIRTTSIPPAPVSGDCRLSAVEDDIVAIECHITAQERPIAVASVSVLADPFGVVFDSADGTLINGARVSLVDAASGAPAAVFAEDGVTRWPSTIFSGQPVTDGAGNIYPLLPGEFRFPLAAGGTYRIVVEPPAPYAAPSSVPAAQLAQLRRNDGTAFAISDASFGAAFVLIAPLPVEVDVPLDRPGLGLSLSKTASRASAAPGEAVQYTITLSNADPALGQRNVTLVDTPSPWLRLRPDSVRIDGAPAGDRLQLSDDGNTLTFRFAEIPPGASHRISYAMVLRPDAPQGSVTNRAEATDAHGVALSATAAIRVEREAIGDRMTLIGRISEGPCTLATSRRGIAGVRVMLEDGSFAITDADGRYHFEGLLPGTHVAQVAAQTLPEGGQLVDCARSTDYAGDAASRFVRGQGGSLVVADFHAVLPEGWAPPAAQAEAAPADDREAAGAETDWLALGDGPPAFLFPDIGHNPRAPAVRVVIRHEADQRVELAADGEAVEALAYDGARTAPAGTHAVSIWRGIPLTRETTRLTATIRNADGSVAQVIERDVAFAAAPARAQLLEDASHLVADGATRPVIAVRITDRLGRPVRAGISGSVTINAPYQSAAELDRLQVQQVSGIGPASPTWTVEGDDGIALIELAPTMVSGPLTLNFAFAEGEVTRRQDIESWIVPGDQEWTLVGLAEGSVGAQSVADAMQRGDDFASDLGDDARIAFYAKGRVLGRFLLTAAYDSAGDETAERLTGAIDPNAYYTVFADGSLRQYDAASTERLYVRVETGTFYAIYGDVSSGFEATRLARHARNLTGVRAEGRFGDVHVQGFASETTTRFVREELQGAGLTGPYALASTAIVPNSESVAIEVRDRFRPDIVVSRTELARFADYDFDPLTGTLTFRQPVLSRDAFMNPQIIVVEYETESLYGTGAWNGGLRADVTVAGGALRLGASAISEEGDSARTDLVAADARLQLGAATEIRAEIAASRTAGTTSTAWLAEVQHHDAALDLAAYARQVDAGFGTGQLSGVDLGRTRFGADARLALTEDLAVIASAWRDDSLTDATRRDAVEARLAWRGEDTDLALGIAHFDDRLADGTHARSTVLEGSATQRLLDNRLQLTGATSIALSATKSVDLPTRHLLGARYAISSTVALTGSYEIAQGDAIDARTLRAGFELTPWSGGRFATSIGQQNIAEYGARSFAAFGAAQSLSVTPSLTLDATLDGNRSLGGANAGGIINPAHPVASGGHLAGDSALLEDFTAVTFGAGWRRDDWALSARGEWRDGEAADREGLTLGAIRQLGNGSAIGAGLRWTRAEAAGGATTQVFDSAVSLAHRPADGDLALLGKLEWRSDILRAGVAGEAGPVDGSLLTISGDAEAHRVLASLSANWTPRGFDPARGLSQGTEIGLFLATRYSFDGFADYDLAGVTALAGLDARIGLSDRLSIGGRATLRTHLTQGLTSFAFGPEIGIVPTEDVLLSLGYNLVGFRDRDFAQARQTSRGFYAHLRLKLDAQSFDFLGLGQ